MRRITLLATGLFLLLGELANRMEAVMRRVGLAVMMGALLVGGSTAHADDQGVAGKRLSIKVDAVAGKQSLAAILEGTGVHVGAGSDPMVLGGSVELYYEDHGGRRGVLPLPAPWHSLTNGSARFKNGLAPAGPTPVRAAAVISGKKATVSSKGVGGIDIAIPPGPNGVVVIFTLDNGSDGSSHRFCTRFSEGDGSTITHRVTANGYRLTAKDGVPIACPARVPIADVSCEFDAAVAALVASEPSYGEGIDAADEAIRQSGGGGTVPFPRCIPVVVHVVHNNGPENISDSQVRDAIRQLNEDFRHMPLTPGFGPGVDTGIRFGLPTRDPNGNPTTGIIRVPPSILAPYSPETIHVSDGGGPGELGLKNLSRWPNDRYLNVWVVRCIIGGLPLVCPWPNSVFTYGYSRLIGQVPQTFPPYDDVDGIVVRHDYFGRTGTAALNVTRTLSHEAGHWLNLYHVFSANPCATPMMCSSSAPTNDPCFLSGDRCCDTAPMLQTSSCTSGTNSCSNDVPNCADPIENYLSYSHGCQNALTADQMDRMNYTLNALRYVIWSPANIAATLPNCSTSCAPRPAGMTLWLPLDEPTGTVANNLAATPDGQHVNGPSFTTGQVDGARCFDGTSQYVEVQNYQALNPGTGNFSIDAWVRRDPGSTGTRTIVDKRFSPSGNIFKGYHFFLDDGQLGVQMGDGIGLPTFTNFLAGTAGIVAEDFTWHHVAVTVNRQSTTGGQFYLDGVPVGAPFNPTVRPGSLTTSAVLRVGARTATSGGVFVGCIDEVEVFNRVLSLQEVALLHFVGPAGKCKCPETIDCLPY